MSIPFTDIYSKAIALFDDPKITTAYETNKIQFHKLMYTFLQNAIAMFTNPASIGIKLAFYSEPSGLMETFDGDGVNKSFSLSEDFEIKTPSVYGFVEGEIMVSGIIDVANRLVTFPDILPVGKQYAIEQYYVGEFTYDFENSFLPNINTTAGNTLIINEIKDILARLLIKAWAEAERNEVLDIRGLMQDSDFKISGQHNILNAKNKWVDQLDTEVLQLQNKLSWNIRFMSGSQMIGRG